MWRLTLLLVLSGCVAISPREQDQPCPRKPSSVAQGGLNPSAMAGTFQLKLIDRRNNKVFLQGSVLRLAEVDSVTRLRAQTGTFGSARRRDLQLRGSLTWNMEQDLRKEEAELDVPEIFLGCRDCLDGDVLVLTPTSTWANGFAGTWYDSQSGLGVELDARNARPMPRAEGYFCAIRATDV